MLAPRYNEDLVPVNEFRSGLAEWLDHVQSSGRPLVLTQRGVAAAVVTSPKMMDEIQEEREVVHVVLRGLADLKAGRVVSDGEVWAGVAEIIREAEQGKGAAPAKRKKAAKSAAARPPAKKEAPKKKRATRSAEAG